MILARRSFLTGLGASLIAAPAIVRASSLMKVKPVIWEQVYDALYVSGDGTIWEKMSPEAVLLDVDDKMDLLVFGEKRRTIINGSVYRPNYQGPVARPYHSLETLL